MPSSGAQPAKSKTLSKREVIEYLGKSKRTVETYISSGRLPVQYINGANGKQAIFDRADVERFKRDMEEPMVRAVVPAGTTAPRDSTYERSAVTALAKTGEVGDFARLLDAIVRVREVDAQPKRWAPWLTLPEAVEFSGLPASYLLAQARAGTIRALNVGTGAREFWRFHRASLAK